MRGRTDTKLLFTDLRPKNTIDLNVISDFGVIFVIPIPPLGTPVLIAIVSFLNLEK